MPHVLKFLLPFVVIGAACAPKKYDDNQSSKAHCTRVGDTCEFTAGKLGVCIAPEGCTKSSCLICQSQH
jgi:hypothetical protein